MRRRKKHLSSKIYQLWNLFNMCLLIYIYIFFSDYIAHCVGIVGMTFFPKSNRTPRSASGFKKWSSSLLFKEYYLRGVNLLSHAEWSYSCHTNGESHLLPMSGNFFHLFLRKGLLGVYIFFLSSKMRKEKLIISNTVEITPSL